MGPSRNSDQVFSLNSRFCGGTAPRAVLACCLALALACSACDRLGQNQEEDAVSADAVQKLPLPQHAQEQPPTAPQVSPVENKDAAPAASGQPAPVQASAAPAGKPLPETRKEGQKKPAPIVDEKKPLSGRAVAAGERKGGASAKGEAKSPAPAGRATASSVDKKTPPAAASRTDRTPAAATTPAVMNVGKKKASPASAGAHSGTWRVVMGPYLLEESMASDLTRVRKAGFSATIQNTGRRTAAMNRLFLGQFDDRAAAQAELEKLKRHTSDAFILEHGGKHAVYAGSYLLENRARSEKDRLAAAGFTLGLRRTDVAVPSRRLVTGVYRDRAAAEKVRKKLEAAGVKSSLVN